MTHKLTIEQAQLLQRSLEDVVGYLTDNSCSDPDCCGGPYYSDKEYAEGNEVLRWYGLEVA